MFNFTSGTPYRHYKGGVYIIHCISTDEATGDLLITYKSLLDDKLWTRSIRVFRQEVEVYFGDDDIWDEEGNVLLDLTEADSLSLETETYLVPRFSPISDEELMEVWYEK